MESGWLPLSRLIPLQTAAQVCTVGTMNETSVTLSSTMLKQALADGLEEWLAVTNKDKWIPDEDSPGFETFVVPMGMDCEGWYEFNADGVEHIMRMILEDFLR